MSRNQILEGGKQAFTQKAVCIDFDGVLSEYSGFKGRGVFGPVVKGAKEFLQKFRREGWRIIIYTARGETGLVEKYLRDHEVPFDYINMNPDNEVFNLNSYKPVAHVYIDDRAVQFGGDWRKTFEEVINFKPWWKEGKDDESL